MKLNYTTTVKVVLEIDLKYLASPMGSEAVARAIVDELMGFEDDKRVVGVSIDELEIKDIYTRD